VALLGQWLIYGRHNAPGVVAAICWPGHPATSAPACVPRNNLTEPRLVRGNTSVRESRPMTTRLQAKPGMMGDNKRTRIGELGRGGYATQPLSTLSLVYLLKRTWGAPARKSEGDLLEVSNQPLAEGNNWIPPRMASRFLES